MSYQIYRHTRKRVKFEGYATVLVRWPRGTVAFSVRGSRFVVCRHLCLAFHVRASRFVVCRHLCLAFHVRASRFAVCSIVVRGSWFVHRGSTFVLRVSTVAERYIQVNSTD